MRKRSKYSIDFTGMRFARLVVLTKGEPRLGKPTWWCKCDCGTIREIRQELLRSGATKSCGCLSIEVGLAVKSTRGGLAKKYKKEYLAWISAKARCTKPGHPQYYQYGLRGIDFCARWLDPNGFENFINDMGACPQGLSLERTNNNKGYSPENCKWATREQQAKNQRPRLAIENYSNEALVGELERRLCKLGPYQITLNSSMSGPIYDGEPPEFFLREMIGCEREKNN